MNNEGESKPVTLSEAPHSLRPADAGELSRILEKASTDKTSIFTGAPPKEKLDRSIFLDLSSLDRIVEHVQEDMVITLETGIKIAELNSYLARSGQWLPVHGSSQNSTVLELIETGNGGPLDTGFGGPRNLVLGLDTIMADGSSFKCGGKIVKNVTGYDLTKLLVGSRSWLGVSHRAHLRLFALPEYKEALLVPLKSTEIIPEFCKRLISSGIAIKVLEIARADFLSEKFESFALVADYGHRKEVEESIDQLESLASSVSGTGAIQRLNEGSLETILEKLSGYSISGDAGDDIVELSAPLKLIAEILDQVPASSFNLRPVLGKLTLSINEDQLGSLEDKLACLTKQCSLASAITLACRSGNDLYKVKSLSKVNQENDARLSALKMTIKKRFDPEFILNPLVRF